MRKQKGNFLRKIMAVFLAVSLAVGMAQGTVPVSVLAAEEDDTIASAWGWKLYADGKLVISSDEGMANLIYQGSYKEHIEEVKSVEIQDGVTAITYSSFNGCTNLMEVTIPSSVTKIERYAFSSCRSLTEITIPASVANIGEGAFQFCRSLTKVTMSGETPPTIGEEVFGECAFVNQKTKGIHVPEGKSSDYKTAWTKYADYVTDTEIIASGTDWSVRYDGKLTISSNNGMTDWTDHGRTDNGKDIRSTEIADGVTSIAANAFEGCDGMTSVTIPSGVTSIGDSAFSGCSKLTGVALPESLTEIAQQAFQGCSKLTEITIPANVTGIGAGAFSGCSSLIKVEMLKDAAPTLGENAFSDCGFIKQKTKGIRVPNGKADDYKIVWTAYADDITDTNITASGTDWTLDFDGRLIISSDTGMDAWREKWTYMGTERIISVEIKNGVTKIAAGAFLNCKNMTDITIPDTVTSVGNQAFGSCASLAEIAIPKDVMEIGEGAFNYCSSLTEITIPEGITEIKNSTFNHCSSLTGISIPSGVTTIGEYVFGSCDSLTEITIPEGVTEIKTSTFSGCENLTDITIPSSMKIIGESAFSLCKGLKTIALPDGLTDIGKLAFYDCDLEEITIPSSVKNIGLKAFTNCDLLTDITIPEGVETIGEQAFYFCRGLISVTIPSSVTSIGKDAFGYCSALSTVTMLGETPPALGNIAFEYCSFVQRNRKGIYVLEGRVDAYKTAWPEYADYITDHTASGTNWVLKYDGSLVIKSDDGMTEWIENGLRDYQSQVKSVEILDGVTGIGEGAFSQCNSLTGVAIPGSVKSIGKNAFSRCSSLTSAAISSGVESIGEGAFSYCEKLTDITIPSSVTDIGASAFYNCKGLTNITIPSGVTGIGQSTFSGCSSLTSVTIPSSVTSIGENAFNTCEKLADIEIPSSVKKIEEQAFYNCKSLTGITIPEGVTSIGNYTFYECSSLTSVTIPSGVAAIGAAAFSGCESLASVTIPSGVTSIGNYTFSGCSNLTRITIPASVTDIGNSAFSGCSELAEVVAQGKNPPTLGYEVFNNCKFVNENTKSIHVPENKLEDYNRRWMEWKNYMIGDIRDIYEGSGTAEEPYLIHSKADLEKLRSHVNGGEDYAGVHFKITADIDLTGGADNRWAPIGTEEHPFKGTLDGDGHTVSGLYINDANKDNQGLFGTNEGTIKNLTVQGEVTGGNNVGGIAGTNKGTIESCTNKANVTGKDNVGGIAGNNGETGKVENSMNSGTVTGTGTGAGGVAGKNDGTLNNNTNTAAVTGKDDVGGIAGTNAGMLKDDTNTAPVTGKDNVGGIAGTNGGNGTVEGCTNSGNVTKTEDGTGNPGAIIGNNQNTNPDAVKDDYYQKTDTVNKDITGIGEGTGAGEGKDPEGISSGETPMPPAAFEGSGTAEEPYLINSKADLEKLRSHVNGGEDYEGVHFKVTADIDLAGGDDNQWTPIGTEEHPFKGTLDGDGHTVSGLYINDETKNNQGLFGTNEGTIKNLTVQGEVTGGDNTAGIAGTNKGIIENCTNKVSVAGKDNAGGITGSNTGTVSGSDNTGSITGQNNVGGVTGNNGGTGKVENSTNKGNVTGTGTGAGGVAGKNEGTLNSNTNTATVTGKDDVGGIAGTNAGTLKDDTNTALVTGKDNVGGIAGTNGENGTVEGCTNSGNVTKTEDGIGNPGAIIGNNQNTDKDAVKDDYYQKTDTVNKDITGIGEGTGAEAGTDPEGITSGQTPENPGQQPPVTDQIIAEAFEDEKIAAIGQAAPVGGTAWKQAVKDAGDAFGRLTESQQKLVSGNAKKILGDAEAILGAVEKMEAIGTVANTPESAKKIKDARDAYDKLTNEQKAMIPESTKKTLTDAEDAYKALTADTGGSQGGNQNNNQNNNLTEEQKKQVQDIAKELGVSEETAAKIQKIAEEMGIPAETLLLGDGAFTGQNSENDIKGSLFSMLQLRASKVKTNSVKLTWKKIKGADGYQIYGTQCLRGNKSKLIKTIKKGSTTTFRQKKLKKGKAYRYFVRAYKIVDGKRITIAASKTIHIFTNGGKYGNAKSVKVNKTKASIKKGKKYKIKASEVKMKKPLRRHRKLSYESSNTKVATVTKKGVIKAKAKGTCTVYVYAQNGVYKKIKVTVK